MLLLVKRKEIEDEEEEPDEEEEQTERAAAYINKYFFPFHLGNAKSNKINVINSSPQTTRAFSCFSPKIVSRELMFVRFFFPSSSDGLTRDAM